MEQLIWLGDLNYRLTLADAKVRPWLARQRQLSRRAAYNVPWSSGVNKRLASVEQLIWLGDLNYRLTLADAKVWPQVWLERCLEQLVWLGDLHHLPSLAVTAAFSS